MTGDPPGTAAPAAGGRARGWLTRNRYYLLGGGVLVAALLGFRAKQSGGVPASGATVDASGAAGGTFDSTASDLFNTISPILEAQGRQIQGLSDQLGQVLAPGPAPTPAPTGAAKKLTNTYNAKGQSILQIEQIAHPGASLKDSENRALAAIHYNMQNSRNRWPAGVAGKDLLNKKITGPVFVV